MDTARCIELLTTGELHLPIEGEPAQWLRAVRHGDVAFDEWWDTCLGLDAELAGLAQDESIRPGPDTARIDSWSVLTHRRVWDARPTGSGSAHSKMRVLERWRSKPRGFGLGRRGWAPAGGP